MLWTIKRPYWRSQELVTIGIFAAAIKLSALLIALAGGGMNPVTLLLKNLVFTTLLIVLVSKVRKFGTLTLFTAVSMVVSVLLMGGSVALLPAAIVGGVSFILYGMIAAIGVRNVVENRVDFTNSRNLIIAAVILVSALGFNSVGGLTFAVAGVSINLSGLAIAAIVGILLNAILPGNDYEFDSADGADAPSSGNLQV